MVNDPRDAAVPQRRIRLSGWYSKVRWQNSLTALLPLLRGTRLFLPGLCLLVLWFGFAAASAWLTPPRNQPLSSGLPVLGSVLTLGQMNPFAPAALGAYAFFSCAILACYLWGVRMASTRHAAITLPSILLFTGLFSLPLVLAPGLLSYDAVGDAAAARIITGGNKNPFNGSILSLPDAMPLYQFATQHTMTTYGGPLWTLLLALLGTFNVISEQDPLASVLTLRITGAALHLTTAWFIWRCGGVLFRAERVAATVLYAWNPLLLAAFVLNATREVVTVAAVLGGLWLYLRQQRVAALVVFTLAATTNLWIGIYLLPPYLALLATQSAGLARIPMANRLWLRSLAVNCVFVAGLVVAALVPVWAGSNAASRIVLPPDGQFHNILLGWSGQALSQLTGSATPLLWEDILRGLAFAYSMLFMLFTVLRVRRLATMLWFWLVAWLMQALLISPVLGAWSVAGAIALATLRSRSAPHRLLVMLTTVGGLVLYPATSSGYPWTLISTLLYSVPPLLLFVIKRDAFAESGFENHVPGSEPRVPSR